MRTLILLTSFLSMHILAPAQISITQNDLPDDGDTLRYSIAGPVTDIDFTETGDNYVWDFSDIDFQVQGLDEYVSVTSVNFLMGLLFGFSSFAQPVGNLLPVDDFDFDIDIEDFYAVYNKNAQQYSQDGFFFIFSDFPVPLQYDQVDRIYQFPLEFGDNDSTAFSGSIALGDSIYLERHGYRINDVDGWGNVTTPYGEFEAIRVRTTLFESDSLYWESLPEPIILNRTTIQYKWLAKNEKLPVMEANYIQFEGEAEFLAGIRYRDIYREPQQVQAPEVVFNASKTEGIEINEPIILFNQSLPGHELNTYEWIIEPGHVSFMQGTNANSAEPVIAFSQQGSYSVTLMAENEAGTDELTKENYLSVTDTGTWADTLNEKEQVQVTITDRGNYIMVHFHETIDNIVLYDIQGRIVHQACNTSNSRPFTLQTGHLKTGIYIGAVYSHKHHAQPVTFKFIKP